jgi:hypothetical protein
VSRILREKRWSSRTWIRILMRRLPRSMSVCRVLMVVVSAHTRDYISEALILADWYHLRDVPCEAKIPADRSVIPVTLMKT